MYRNVSHTHGNGFTGYSDAWKCNRADAGLTYKRFVKKTPVNSCHRCIIKAVLKNGYKVEFETHKDYSYIDYYMSKLESLVEWKVGETINLKIIDILSDDKKRVKAVFFSLKQNNMDRLTGYMKELIKKRRMKNGRS